MRQKQNKQNPHTERQLESMGEPKKSQPFEINQHTCLGVLQASISTWNLAQSHVATLQNPMARAWEQAG